MHVCVCGAIVPTASEGHFFTRETLSTKTRLESFVGFKSFANDVLLFSLPSVTHLPLIVFVCRGCCHCCLPSPEEMAVTSPRDP